jgi:hypothetical protein
MKIDYAIMASDDNPLYLDFWEPVSKLWKLKFNIEPVLLYFGEGKPCTTYGSVIQMLPVAGVPIATQCQWARYWYATTIGNNIGIITDIDMFPLSPFYFIDQLDEINENLYIHLNPCFNTYPNIAACYHVAKGKTFQKVLQLPKTFTASIKELVRMTHQERDKWYSDEIFSTWKIRGFPDKKIFYYIQRDGGQNGHRIDRPRWNYNIQKVDQNWYYDAHCPRPYKDHKEDLDNLVRLALNATIQQRKI